MSMDVLQEKIRKFKNPSMAGLDPSPELIPEHLLREAFAQHGETPRGLAEAYRAFCGTILETLKETVPAVKLQTACFEALGAPGMAVLQELCASARELGYYVLLDAMRGDVGHIAALYAEAVFGRVRIGETACTVYDCDGVTLNGYLGEFSINVDMLREALILEKKADLYIDYLYGDNGAEALTDDDRETYYENNYVRFQQIYINNIKVYETDSKGYYIQDENGNYQMRDLTDEESAEAERKIKAVREALERGDDFSELQAEYSDSKDYTGGYYFSAESASDYLTSVVSAAFTLDEGEWMYVDAASPSGAFFIKRLPLDEGGYKADANSDFFDGFDDAVMGVKFAEKVESLRDEITVDRDFLDSVTVKDSPANYYYY